jgi:hypothetical protein
LPDSAVVTNVRLQIRVDGFDGFGGTNVFTPTKTHGDLLVDIRKPYFGTRVNLDTGDFQAAGVSNAGSLTSAPTPGWYTIVLGSAAHSTVNLTGSTQVRLRFAIGDNDDNGSDYIRLFSGNASAENGPRLIVDYSQ